MLGPNVIKKRKEGYGVVDVIFSRSAQVKTPQNHHKFCQENLQLCNPGGGAKSLEKLIFRCGFFVFFTIFYWCDCFWLSTPPNYVSPFHLYRGFWGLESRTMEGVKDKTLVLECLGWKMLPCWQCRPPAHRDVPTFYHQNMMMIYIAFIEWKLCHMFTFMMHEFVSENKRPSNSLVPLNIEIVDACNLFIERNPWRNNRGLEFGALISEVYNCPITHPFLCVCPIVQP